MLRVRFVEKQKNFFTDKQTVSHYSHLEQNQGLFIFFPTKYKYVVVDENNEADISIVGIQHEDNHLLRENELNTFISVENLSVGRTHYRHFNKYNKYNNDKIDLYYYNDVTRLNHNTIPIPLCFIKQFKYMETVYEPILQNKFDDKLFCLAISKNNLNHNKNKIIYEMSRLGRVDHISAYNHILSNKSCYNTPEILGVFNRYKFIICVENSKTPGYITEKIFNVFLSKSIPIYDGAPDICDYINEEAFIKYDETFIKKVMFLLSSRGMYNNMINQSKIKNNPIITEFEKNLENIFDSHLAKKNIIPK